MLGHFQDCLRFSLLPENDGQPCHATTGDPGGLTAWGVTHATLCSWLGRQATLTDMRTLTSEAVAPIYRAYFWGPLRGDGLQLGVDLMAFDHSVTSGCAASARLLQGAVGVKQDGIIGPITLAACAAMPRNDLIQRLADTQEAAYRAMRDYWRFGRGWISRLDRRHLAATEMLTAI